MIYYKLFFKVVEIEGIKVSRGFLVGLGCDVNVLLRRFFVVVSILKGF